MGILELLFDNLFFVVIILGFLSSLWAKRKQEEKQEQARRQPQQQTTLPKQIGEYNLPTTVERQPEYSQHEYSQPEYRVDLPPMNGGSQESVFNVEAAPTEASKPVNNEVTDKLDKTSSPYYNRKSNVHRKPSTTASETTMSSVSFVNEPLSKKAVEGMMWAEVFGSPRSKKPFRGGSYRR